MTTTLPFTSRDRAGLIWTTTLVAALVVAARYYVRVKLRALGTDDWLMLMALAWAFSSAGMSQNVLNAVPATLSDLERSRYQAVQIMSSVAIVLSLAFGKTSVGCLLLRVLSPGMRLHRWFIKATIAGICFLGFTVVIITIFPVCNAAQFALKSSNGCSSYQTYLGVWEAWSFYGVFVDIAFSMLPALFISKLNISRDGRIALCVLMGLGWITSIFTILRAITPFVNWSSGMISRVTNVASTMEQAMVLICGSLPALAPFWHSWKTGESISSGRADRSRIYVGATKEPPHEKGSVSTAGGWNANGQHKVSDESVSGTRVDRQFDVTSSHRDASLV